MEYAQLKHRKVYIMSIFKRIVSAALALLLIPVLLPVGTAQAAAAKKEGYENGNGLKLTKLGSYVSGISDLDGGVAEIVSYDVVDNKAWVVNGATGKLDILNLGGITCGTSDAISAVSLDIKAMAAEMVPGFSYGDMTSASVNADLRLVAVALQSADYDQNGYVGLLNTDGEMLAMIEAGIQPDMLTFNRADHPEDTVILVANEGEPREGYGERVTDPAGSVTIVHLNVDDLAASIPVNVGFDAFDSQREELVANGVILGKGNMPSVDLEPEYIACDYETAYITLQENNAVAVLDLESGTFTGVYSLGYQDYSLEENAVDLVEDGEYAAKSYPDAVGAYMPDGISMYESDGKTYLVTANEGDAREWGADETEYCNEIKQTLTAADGTEAEKVRTIDPKLTDGLPEGKTVLYGSRSFSVYRVDEDGLTQVFDSGNDFESKTAQYLPDYFNCSNDDNDHDSRSAKKGPEPESVTVGSIGNSFYVFVALERTGGIMAYEVDTSTNPETAVYTNYINTRDFSENPGDAAPEASPDFYLTGDVAPEGMYLINTPDTAILLVAYEVSGTVSAYAVGDTYIGHGLVDGFCVRCGETVVVNTTDIVAETTEAAPTVENAETAVAESNHSVILWILVAVAAIIVIVIFAKKKK